MISELSFLIELLLKHNLPSETKDLIAMRIKDVEGNLVQHNQAWVHHPLPPWSQQPAVPTQLPANLAQQAPSTIAAMMRHSQLNISASPSSTAVPAPPPIPIEAIAKTPAAAEALDKRQQSIADAIGGKMDKIRGHPKKW